MAGTSSFDVEPAGTLDPDLFDGKRMKPEVRMHLLSTLSAFISTRYGGVNEWLRAWLAGSGASYRWHSSAGLRDLDILLGIDYIAFRRANPSFVRMGDAEIARHLNDDLRHGLWPTTEHWQDQYEVTWYVNPHSWDIRQIKPYAAYDLIYDGWTVPPSMDAPRVGPDWALQADLYRQRAQTAVQRYSQSLAELQSANNPAHRRDAELRFHMAVDQSVALFDTVHNSRRAAFSTVGGGYDDFGNYLWQQGKKTGWINALRTIKEYSVQATREAQQQNYGLELPDVDTLIRRAALHNR
jgi:hypothetical protein